MELNTAANGQTTQAVTITNTGDQAVRVRAALSDWSLSNAGSPQFATATDVRYSATPWVRIAPPEQVVEPNHDATVRFTLAVPADAAPAGYRTAILFDFEPASAPPVSSRHQILVKSRIATLIYVNVGEPPVAVDLTDLQIRQRPHQPTQIVAQLKNTGRRSVRTRGTLSLYDGSGALVRQTVVPDVPVLPESEREVAISTVDPSQPALPPGTYRVEVKIDVGAAAVLVGETTLKVP
ncbi:MAG TPA: hypothetical protein VFX12_03380 [Vicinamibacterales bacterium]|nr:hypothetical protein [Vicinamibacterales bacterium]